MMLFIFDMDDVLYDYDWRQRMAGMTGLTGLSLAELRERWWHAEGEWAAEAGRIGSADDYLAAFNAAIGIDVDEADWVRVRGAAMTPWADSIAAVRRAAELGQVTLLTNNGPLTSRHLRSLAPELVPVFGDHLFTSSDYGARKPDPEVFEGCSPATAYRRATRSSPTTCQRTSRALARSASPGISSPAPRPCSPRSKTSPRTR